MFRTRDAIRNFIRKNVQNKVELTLGTTGVLAAQLALALAKEVVLVALATAPAELHAAHRCLIKTPACKVTSASASILRLLALV